MSRALSGFLCAGAAPGAGVAGRRDRGHRSQADRRAGAGGRGAEALAMNRDLVLATLIVALCGSAIWLAGWLPARPGGAAPRRADARRSAAAGSRSGCRSCPRRRRWRRWRAGRLQEPRLTDEILRPLTPLFVAPIAGLWLRAAWRAGRALARPRVPPLAATLGLWRPRIAIDDRLSRDLDATARRRCWRTNGRTATTAIRCGSGWRRSPPIFSGRARAPPPASSAGGRRWSSPATKRHATAASTVRISRRR